MVGENRLGRGGQSGLGDVYEVVFGRGGWARRVVDVHLSERVLLIPRRDGSKVGDLVLYG